MTKANKLKGKRYQCLLNDIEEGITATEMQKYNLLCYTANDLPASMKSKTLHISKRCFANETVSVLREFSLEISLVEHAAMQEVSSLIAAPLEIDLLSISKFTLLLLFLCLINVCSLIYSPL